MIWVQPRLQGGPLLQLTNCQTSFLTIVILKSFKVNMEPENHPRLRLLVQMLCLPGCTLSSCLGSHRSTSICFSDAGKGGITDQYFFRGSILGISSFKCLALMALSSWYLFCAPMMPADSQCLGTD